MATLGLEGSEKKVHRDRVFFPDGTAFGEVGVGASSFRYYELVTHVAPLGGGLPTFAQDLDQADDIERSVAGALGSTKFRARLARSGVAESAVRLALSAGLLKSSDGCVFLSSRKEIQTRAAGLQRSAASAAAQPQPSAPAAPAAPTAAAVAPLVTRLETLLSQPDGGAGEEASLAPEDQRVAAFFTTQHPNFEMLPLVTTAFTVLRNESHVEDWYSFSHHLHGLVYKCFTLGLHDDRLLLDGVLFRGDDMILQGGTPTAVLRVFTDMLPNARHFSRETTFRDRGKLKATNKLTGAAGAASWSAAGYSGPTHLPCSSSCRKHCGFTNGAGAPGTGVRSVSPARGWGVLLARSPRFGFPSVPPSAAAVRPTAVRQKHGRPHPLYAAAAIG